ncbi:MAG: hypothetical protein GF411_02790 [Candidatus Lokiarchaeota archaeon]|nr:hypothetical protein [Candidatus Lokiarchaeota archaeon]
MPVDTKDIVNYYNDGHAIKECAIRFGLHPETIRVRLRKAGIKDARHRTNPLPPELIEYYKSGHSISKCSRKFGVSPSKISKELKSLGVKRSKPQNLEISSNRTRELWKSDEYRSKVIKNNTWNNERRKRASDKIKEKWKDKEYKAAISQSMIDKWSDDEFKSQMLSKFRNSEYVDRMRHISIEKWKDDEYRSRMINIFLECRSDPEYRQKMADTWKNPDLRKLLSEKAIRKWQDPEFKQLMSEIMTVVWQDQNRRQRMGQIISELWNDDGYRNKLITILSDRAVELWKDPEYRQKMTKIIRDRWQDDEFRKKMIGIINQNAKVSNIQKILYSILDDLNIKYYREYESDDDKCSDPECQIGPHLFDCMIPRNDKPDLLIECQGDYWHNLDHKITNDKSKSTYIERYYSDTYEIKYLWEHEFLNHNKIVEVIKYWLGIHTTDMIDFKLGDVEIRECPAKDYKILLSKYHYLPNAGRGGISYGAYVDDILIATCIFSPLVRQNITIKDFSRDQIRELSRLCIHPQYQKKNFATWFISRCIKRLDRKFKCVISYCDTTFNHDGAVYKAANFIHDKDVAPDYWYAHESGWIMHKRTLYRHAKSLKLTEAEFADKHGYRKVYGKKKLRFVYERQ